DEAPGGRHASTQAGRALGVTAEVGLRGDQLVALADLAELDPELAEAELRQRVPQAADPVEALEARVALRLHVTLELDLEVRMAEVRREGQVPREPGLVEGPHRAHARALAAHLGVVGTQERRVAAQAALTLVQQDRRRGAVPGRAA